MKNNRIFLLSSVIKALLVLVTLILLGLVYFLFTNSYEKLVEIFVSVLGIEDRKEIFKERIFPKDKLVFLRWLSAIVLIVFSFLAIRIYSRSVGLAERLRAFFFLSQSVIAAGLQSFRDLSWLNKALFLFSFFAVIIYRLKYLFIYPLTNDELFTWIYFVEPGFLSSTTYYPGPNNHIFYSVACNFIDLFTNNTILTLRLPAFLAGSLSVAILFLYFLKRYSFPLAFLVMVFYSTFSNIFYYSIHGRGYVFIFLFFILLLISVVELLKRKDEEFWKVLFIASTILGFYSVPIFLYPFLSLTFFAICIFLYQKKYVLLKRFFKWCFLSGIITFLLYLPVFILSGWRSVTGNSFVKPVGFDSFISGLSAYLKDLAVYLWDSDYGIYFSLALFFISALFLLFKKERKWIFLALCCFIIPLLLLLIQQVHPFVRIWNYLLIIFSLILALLINVFIKQIRVKWMSHLILLLIFIFSAYNLYTIVHSYVSKGFPYYTTVKQSLAKALQRDVKTAYAGEEAYFLYLKYYSLKGNLDVQVESSPMDTPPDLVILPLNSEMIYPEADYYLMEDNAFVRLWLKKQAK